MPNLKSVLHDLQQQRNKLKSQIERIDSAMRRCPVCQAGSQEPGEVAGGISHQLLEHA